jgi:hypothetical protein
MGTLTIAVWSQFYFQRHWYLNKADDVCRRNGNEKGDGERHVYDASDPSMMCLRIDISNSKML